MVYERVALAILRTNRRDSNGYYYTLPSVEHYPYQWLWDSCFHAIVLARFEPEIAKSEIRALLSKQFENGMVPHIIYWTPGLLHLVRWGVGKNTSSLTQPPMLAYAVWEINRHTSDLAYLESVFPQLMAYYRYLLIERDPFGHGMAGIVNPDESGEDNSPRFDNPLEISPPISLRDHEAKRRELVDRYSACNFDIPKCMYRHFWVYDVTFNAILVENLHILERIALALGRADEAAWAASSARRVSEAMRRDMFEDGVYWSLSGEARTKLKVHTWAHFMPLFAGLYTPPEAEAVVREHLKNSETFYGPYGIRTASRREPSYHAATDEFSWRGPVWIGAHWFIYQGLVRYGFMNEARDIREKSEALIRLSGFRECFNAETGDGNAAKGFTWGTLVLDMYHV